MTAGASASCASRSILPTAFEDGTHPAATRAPQGAAADRQSRLAAPTRLCHGELNCLNFDSPTVVRGPAIAGHAAPGRLRQDIPVYIAPAERPVAPVDQPWVQGHFLTLAYHDVEDEDPDQGFQRAHRPAGRPAELAARERLPGRLGGPDPGRAPARRQAAARARRAADLRRRLPQLPDPRAAHPQGLRLAGGAGAGGHVDGHAGRQEGRFRRQHAAARPLPGLERRARDLAFRPGGDRRPHRRLALRRAGQSPGQYRAGRRRAQVRRAQWPLRERGRLRATHGPRRGRDQRKDPPRHRQGAARLSGPMAPRAAPRCASPANRVIRWR